MDWFKMIKRYYDLKCYSKDPNSSMYVGKFVEYGSITVVQFKEITGDDYPTA
ncbi:XkdX family protein [Paenibacillus sp. NAIST15-1]|uniref:XkdX family protein n=1 Tax=Paenibacillus sp. NAIST15-1 TaxID=1605994 RepID=UPI00086AAFF2|nr:XkdX family protein [Paenibacillus sp. NAIST15-1]GAV11275.1 putative phage protein [Paenibacillus sp. NAIST15-1]